MEIRYLGKTGLKVPVIGFGAARIGIHDMGIDESIKIIREAYDFGIRYFDTARSYGDSEEKLGLALKDFRDDCILATKVHFRGKDEAERSLRQSLRCLGFQSIDIAQLHGIDSLEDLKKALAPDGAMQALREARDQGKVRFIGITGHVPYVLSRAIESGNFDTVLAPLNIFEREALEELLPLARKMEVAFIVMKPFLLHYDQQTNIVRSGGGFDRFTKLPSKAQGKPTVEIEGSIALKYVLAHDISVVVPGFRSVEEVRQSIAIARGFQGLTEDERRLTRFGELPPEPFCRECGLCMPCPEFIDIRTVLRLQKLATYYGLKEYASKKYRSLPTKADFCNRCGECEARCPYQLPIMKMLKRADDELRGSNERFICP
ncbi:aldo/keto reductase [Candidatus Bathyarchaeota archaeon]|nr:aldo/keto reductase [Candidatus Bathyarchaeota archaeon]MBS7627503.1 aldo/keto reductase [Candidatus Bathyarchaeota archaeon]